MGIHDIYPNDLIEKAAEEFKKIESIKPPIWAGFVKTGVHKERAPVDPDWWYKRAAAVLRSVEMLGPIGVSKLRTKYGGKKRRGHKPPHFRKGSGSVIRKVLQQLEKTGFIKQTEIGVHKGRIITKQGKLFLNKIAQELSKNVPKKEEAKAEVKEKPKTEKKEIKEEKPTEEKKVSKKEKLTINK